MFHFCSALISWAFCVVMSFGHMLIRSAVSPEVRKLGGEWEEVSNSQQPG